MTSAAPTATKQALPTLTGSRLKTRKRDEKEKYDPKSFRDEILIGLRDTGNNFEDKLKFLDTKGNQLDYRQYADTLFDILIAGGMLLPGKFLKGRLYLIVWCHVRIILFLYRWWDQGRGWTIQGRSVCIHM